ncbi:MAG TPA: hypothetical protein VK168_07520 [Saprospiraceae bacterium]|nr:hypothetical protein [Saprospiraceae bacterium]
MPKRIKISIYIAITIFLMVKTYPIWARSFSAGVNALLQIAGLLLVLTLLILGIIGLLKLFFNENYKKVYAYIPIIIVPVIFAETIYNPLNIDADILYGKVVYEACFEGTQNQAKFKLRENGHFDIHWTGVFFYDEYFIGKYEEKNDTLYLNFNKGFPPRNMGNKALKVVGSGVSFFDKDDKLLKPNPYFYEGKCKGLN